MADDDIERISSSVVQNRDNLEGGAGWSLFACRHCKFARMLDKQLRCTNLRMLAVHAQSLDEFEKAVNRGTHYCGNWEKSPERVDLPMGILRVNKR